MKKNIQSEPLLTEEDHRIWTKWKRICLLHARTKSYKRRVELARSCIKDMHFRCPDAYIAWSAGKDSTAMTHLIASIIPGVRAMSIKDDCDFPDEVEYIQYLANKWNVNLDVIGPDFSMQDYLASLDTELDSDLHSRTSEFSKLGFYSIIEEYRNKFEFPGVFLGLRKAESDYRLLNRIKNGMIYTKADGETVCQPICDWSNIDVYAYLFEHDIELLPVYRCVRLHKCPGDVRKSWWVTARGRNVIWLRTYYPSLYNRLRQLIPGIEALS